MLHDPHNGGGGGGGVGRLPYHIGIHQCISVLPSFSYGLATQQQSFAVVPIGQYFIYLTCYTNRA